MEKYTKRVLLENYIPYGFNTNTENRFIRKRPFLLTHINDYIFIIQDIFYNIYITMNIETNNISIYQFVHSEIDNNEKIYFFQNLTKNELKKLIINNTFTQNNEVNNHFVCYDYNLWNNINDWLNNPENKIKIQYSLLYSNIRTLIPYKQRL